MNVIRHTKYRQHFLILVLNDANNVFMQFFPFIFESNFPGLYRKNNVNI